jgi:uridine nucleosidase
MTIRNLFSKSPSTNAVQGLEAAVKKCLSEDKKVYVIATGPLTNIALFSAVHPDLIPGIAEIIFMGGGVGVGNRSAVAEFNILCDPEAAQMVLNLEVPKVMIPLNVTHTAILTPALHARLLRINETDSSVTTTPLRRMLSSLVRYVLKHSFNFFVLKLLIVSSPSRTGLRSGLPKARRSTMPAALHISTTLPGSVPSAIM